MGLKAVLPRWGDGLAGVSLMESCSANDKVRAPHQAAPPPRAWVLRYKVGVKVRVRVRVRMRVAKPGLTAQPAVRIRGMNTGKHWHGTRT